MQTFLKCVKSKWWINIDHPLYNNSLVEYEDPNQALSREHLEGWFDGNVWAVIIDRAF